MSGEAVWAHFRMLYPTLLGPGAEELAADLRALVTLRVVMGV